MRAATAASPTYRRLQRRNRLVGLLRLALPLAGGAVLFALLVQIVLSSIGTGFSMGSISVSPQSITVEAPDYFGVIQDGSRYRVSAATARSAIARPDLIELSEGKLVYDRVDGIQFTVDASQAVLDTASQQVTIPGLADISDSTGTTGTLGNTVFDFKTQGLVSKGDVAVDYADGTTVRAEGLVHDAATMVWTFTRSVVTLPSTPGQEDMSEANGDMIQ